jgi:N-acetylglutamate synthase-like GNAT family acetyltransferase
MATPARSGNSAPLTDRVLKCKDCSQDFIFSVREQEFFAQRGFEHAPKRCLDCRRKRTNRRRG